LRLRKRYVGDVVARGNLYVIRAKEVQGTGMKQGGQSRLGQRWQMLIRDPNFFQYSLE
jgi:hypothetical protein